MKKVLVNNSNLKPRNVFIETDYEKWERREQRHEIVSDVIASIIAFVLIILMVILVAGTSSAKVKKYVGTMTCTTYHVSDNTPRYSRATSTGHRATEWRTIAVDIHSPVFNMGDEIYVEGFGWGIIEDVGDFARYGTELDLFTPEGVGFKKECKVYRPETGKEKQKRLAKERKKKQEGWFTLVYNPTLAPWQIITDKDIIPGGTCRMGYNWLDVVETHKHIGQTIQTGNMSEIQRHSRIKLDEVIEEAVG